MANDIVYANALAEELQKIIRDDVRPVIGLTNPGAHIQDVLMLPPATLSTLVDGVWIRPIMTFNEPDAIPTPLMQRYMFRLVYVRKMLRDENPVKQDMIKNATLINKIVDKFTLPNITGLPAHAQVLWCMWKNTEWEPGEDDYISRIAADLKAVANVFEITVRTKRT